MGWNVRRKISILRVSTSRHDITREDITENDARFIRRIKRRPTSSTIYRGSRRIHGWWAGVDESCHGVDTVIMPTHELRGTHVFKEEWRKCRSKVATTTRMPFCKRVRVQLFCDRPNSNVRLFAGRFSRDRKQLQSDRSCFS